MSNLLEPWVLLRVVAGLCALALFARAAAVGVRVLRHYDLRRASEGQLALERQLELAATLARAAAVVQVGTLLLSCLAADRLSHGIRGAMCAYGVFAADRFGFASLLVTFGVALVAGVVAQLFAFDARLPRLELARPLSVLVLVMAPLAAVDFGLSARFSTDLDLSVTASCCSVQLDSAAAGNIGYASGPRVLVTAIACAAIAASVLAALFAARRPLRRGAVAFAGLLALTTLPFALAAAVLEVAPHAFERPEHVCPFCLLRGDVYGIGYPLFGAVFLAAVWGVGAAASSALGARASADDAVRSFVRGRLLREAAAWAVAFVVGAAPVVRWALVARGASLFP